MTSPSFPWVRSLAAAALLASWAPPARAREHWPVPTATAAAQRAAFAEHAAAVERRIQPALAAWAKKGKPSIPWAALPCDLPQATVPAFPGAVGGGEYSFGGRGGKVYVVTNLNDSGPGSFREACEAAGPRIVVFNVAGIIHLKEPVEIDAPYLTIAGQTAPGNGVCIAGETTQVNTHDVVIRYLRFRRGNTDVWDRDNALGGDTVGNLVYDHCSASWGNDQTLSLYRHIYYCGSQMEKLPAVNVTIENCIVSEALNPNNHAFAADWGGRNDTFYHNLFACCTARNPSIAMGYGFNFVDNVLFNWGHRSIDGGDLTSRINLINNYFKPGPATQHNPVRYRVLEPAASWSREDPVYRFGRAYVAGNFVVGDPAVTADNWNGGVQFEERNRLVEAPARLAALIASVRADRPFPMAPVPITSAAEAYPWVLDHAGDTLPARDAVDVRILREVRTGKPTYRDGIITDISQVGGYPVYAGTPARDLGPDGIPLWWKRKYGLNPDDPNLANEDLQGDGYTVMDKYLDGLDPRRKIDWSDPAAHRDTLTLAALRPPGA